MKICGIVGWKNSGKTFLHENSFHILQIKNLMLLLLNMHIIILILINLILIVFYIVQAGSQQVIISSSKRWAKISELNKSNEKTLYELIDELNMPDIIIVEGFKNEKHAKIEIIKDDSDPSTYLFPHLKNVIGIVADFKIETSIKQFKKNEIAIIANYILQRT